MTPRTRLTVLAALTTATTAAMGRAGPLSPPAGPVAPTHKTLSQLEPRTPVGPDTTPGDQSAVFTINQPGSYYLTGNISVPSGKSGVSIVAPGVTLDLNGFTITGEPGSADGVRVILGCQRVSVRNGTIKACGGHGVHYDIDFTDGGVIEDIIAMNSGASGITAGRRAAVRRCQAHSNAADGIATRYAGQVTDCLATNNGGDGFEINTVGAVTGSSAILNGEWGVRAFDNARVERCHLNANGTAGAAGGISATNFCTVAGNSVDFHPNQHALHAAGEMNTFENNTVTRAGVGISADGPRNLIVRNSFKSCGTPTIIAGGNVHGPFISVIGGADLGAVPASSHPAANTVQ